MSILEKLSKARIDFHAANIKKTGYNKFSNYAYFELCDIMPKILELSNKYRFICTVSFNAEIAVLKVIDLDDQKQVYEFTSPMSSANLKGMHEIQNLGAVETYIRRYLYLLAFEIIENDEFDRDKNGNGSNNGHKEPENRNTQNSNQNNQKPAQNGLNGANSPQNNANEGKAIVTKIGEILNTIGTNGRKYFTEEEIDAERNIIKNTKEVANLKIQLKRLADELAKRNEFDDIPFGDSDDGFEDDLP